MSNACPLNFKRVDENSSRISALIVSFLVLLYLYTNNVYILLFLSLDFYFKLFFEKEISFINKISKQIMLFLKFQKRYVDGGAKRLAGFFALFFMFSLLLTHLLHSWTASLLVAILYLSCALLDAFFSFCIGCKIYFIIKKIYPNFMSNS